MCDKIDSFLCIWSHLLRKSLKKNLIFCAMYKMLIAAIQPAVYLKYYFADFKSEVL